MKTPRKMVTRSCLFCLNEFTFYDCPSNAKRRGSFCSRQCWRSFAKRSLAERFNALTGSTDSHGCLLWAGAKQSRGYGHILGSGGKAVLAHRVAWELANGPIPFGLDVLHTCDNPQCVNVAHLFLGTDADNAQDKSTKGRAPRGQGHRNAKLSEADVRVIRTLYATGDSSQSGIADRFGVSQAIVSRIVNRIDWAHLE